MNKLATGLEHDRDAHVRMLEGLVFDLTAQAVKHEEALAFYADPVMWMPIPTETMPANVTDINTRKPISLAFLDHGDTARLALVDNDA
ncbi:MAG: hypothetical protein WC491_08085 [Candidatus Omnitrophota bacterium]|jgi:hypothetical protein